MLRLHIAMTATLPSTLLAHLRAFLDAAFADHHSETPFSDDDWAHAIGGTHVWLEDDGALVSHASVVTRRLTCGEMACEVGYVEAVATVADRRRLGHGTTVMREVNSIIAADFALGALSTGTPSFYASLGWESWRGQTLVDSPDGRVRTPDDDGGIMILKTPRTSPSLDLDATIVADWRAGDVW